MNCKGKQLIPHLGTEYQPCASLLNIFPEADRRMGENNDPDSKGKEADPGRILWAVLREEMARGL